MWLEQGRRREAYGVEALKRIYFGLVPVPWLLAALLLMNGGFDRGPKAIWDARVVSRFADVRAVAGAPVGGAVMEIGASRGKDSGDPRGL